MRPPYSKNLSDSGACKLIHQSLTQAQYVSLKYFHRFHRLWIVIHHSRGLLVIPVQVQRFSPYCTVEMRQ